MAWQKKSITVMQRSPILIIDYHSQASRLKRQVEGGKKGRIRVDSCLNPMVNMNRMLVKEYIGLL